ncbi:hypothetical protein Tco_0933891 [Tanacetum coccineum]
MKELPSKFNNLTRESKELKKHVHELEIELLGDLKEILTKLEKFSSTVSSQVSSIQAKIKTLDALPSLLNKVTKALYRFAQSIEIASHKAADQNVPSVGQAGTHPAEGPPKTSSQYEGELINSKGKETMSHKETGEEESETGSEPAVMLTDEHIKEKKRIKESINADMAKKEEVVGKEELVDLLGVDVVTEMYKAKIKYDKYCDKMLNRRMQSRITNCDVLTRKGLITLKVYRNDGTDEVTPNFKANDLHLSEWRDVMQACPKRTRAGWTSIYEKIQTRMHNLYKTEQELRIDFNKPLGEQDPLDKLNDIARKKRKHADDIHDYFRSTKRYKSSVQYEDHPARIVLNEPCLVGKKKIVCSLTTDFNLGYLNIQIRGDCWLCLAEDNSTSALQFSLVDNSKLNDVDLLLEAEMKCFSFRRFKRREKDCFISKGIHKISLGKDTSKVGIEVQLLSVGKIDCNRLITGSITVKSDSNS